MSNPFSKIIQLGFITTSLILVLASSTHATEVIENQTHHLSQIEVSKHMENLPGWTIENQQLCRTYQFKDFVEAIDFVNRLVEPAETAGHHPDISISYNKVSISLTTHDAGGLTQKDFDLAKIISQLSTQP